MRGKVKPQPAVTLTVRITPAYAGKSSAILHTPLRLSGSPPPMRGKVRFSSKKSFQPGITPAYAGKSYFHENNQRKSRDHPRLCGEKYTRR